MDKLTKEDKETLAQFTKHPGFKIMERLVENKRQELFARFETASLGNENTAIELSNAQNYLAGMRGLVATVKGEKQHVVKAPDFH